MPHDGVAVGVRRGKGRLREAGGPIGDENRAPESSGSTTHTANWNGHRILANIRSARSAVRHPVPTALQHPVEGHVDRDETYYLRTFGEGR